MKGSGLRALAQTAGSFRQVNVSGPGNRSGTALSREVRPVVSYWAEGGFISAGAEARRGEAAE